MMAIPVLMIVAGILGWLRNDKVCQFRMALIASANADAGRPEFWTMLQEFNRVPYGAMFWSFRPLESFYAGTRLLESHKRQQPAARSQAA